MPSVQYRHSVGNSFKITVSIGSPGITFGNSLKTMATLDENPIKQSLLKAIRKGNCQKVTEILKAHPDISANETVDSAQNRLLHKAARYVQCMLNPFS